MKRKRGIGIISPSKGLMQCYCKRVMRGVNYLESCGYKVRFGTYSLENLGYVSATIEQRISDINEFIFDEGTDVILASIGGYNCNQLIGKLDYESIKKCGKIFCGYSDVTALLMAIYSKTGIQVIYGLTFLPEICEYPTLYDYSERYFFAAINQKKIYYSEPQYNITQFVDWNDEENSTPVIKAKDEPSGWRILNRGRAKGKIVGGNLQTLLYMIGSEYFSLSLLKDNIFFFEDTETEPAKIDAMLYALKNHNVFDLISGLVIGKFVDANVNHYIEGLIMDIVDRKDIPILYNVDFGHVNPKISIPIGGECILALSDRVEWSVN
jgi:muramoyltetrapeptide carboxypeptidase